MSSYLISLFKSGSVNAELGFTELGFAELGFVELGFAELGFGEFCVYAGSSIRKKLMEMTGDVVN